jgi:hypothetical protein
MTTSKEMTTATATATAAANATAVIIEMTSTEAQPHFNPQLLGYIGDTAYSPASSAFSVQPPPAPHNAPLSILLRETAGLIANGWLKGFPFDVPQPHFRTATRFCLIGAVFFVADRYLDPLRSAPYKATAEISAIYWDMMDAVSNVSNVSNYTPLSPQSSMTVGGLLASWNDDPSRTQAEIVAVLNRAAQTAEAHEAEAEAVAAEAAQAAAQAAAEAAAEAANIPATSSVYMEELDALTAC